MANLNLATVRGDEVIPLPIAAQRLGLGESSLRAARRKGLKIRYLGRRGYLLGSDLIRFLVENDEADGTSK